MIALRFFLKIICLLILLAIKDGLGSEFVKSLLENSKIIAPILNFAIFWFCINIIIRFSQFIYRKRKKEGHKFSDNVIVGLKNIYYMLSGFAIFVMVLGFFGLELKELLTALGLVAAGLAIISKELFMDIICGINFSFSKDLAIGDYVQIGSHEGHVFDLNIHKIVLKNHNVFINIPNSKAYFSDIKNFSHRTHPCYQFELTLPIEYCEHKSQIQNEMEIVLNSLFGSSSSFEVGIHYFKVGHDEVSLIVLIRSISSGIFLNIADIKDRLLTIILARHIEPKAA